MFLAKNLLPGGTERQLVQVASALARRGLRMGVACVQPPCAGEEDTRGLLGPQVEVFRLDCVSWRDRRAVPRLVRLLRAVRPQVVHCFLGEQNIIGAAAKALWPGFRLVASRRSTDWGVGRLQHALERAASVLADAIVAPSRRVMEFHRRQEHLPARKCHVIPNGVVIPPLPGPEEKAVARRGLGIPEGCRVVGTLGRHVPEKALDVLIEAAAALPSDAVVAVAGGGPLLERHGALVARLGLERRVLLLGHLREPGMLLRALDLFVLPSVSEGSPNALLEAMAFGLPVVATAIPGVLDLLPGEGWPLVPPREPSALAREMTRLLSSPGECASLGARARRRAQELSIDNVAAMHEALYRHLAEGRD